MKLSSSQTFGVHTLMVSCLLCCCDSPSPTSTVSNGQYNGFNQHQVYNPLYTPVSITPSYDDSPMIQDYEPDPGEPELEPIERDPVPGLLTYGIAVQARIDQLDQEIRDLLNRRTELEKNFNANAIELQGLDQKVQAKRAERDKFYSTSAQ